MVKLSEKHGVNPTIPVCFWCQGQKNEVVLLGKLPGDAEAPRYCVVDYEPCDKCKEMMAQGCTVIEVTSDQLDYPPIQQGLTPTGRWLVVASERLFEDKVLVDKELFEELISNAV